MQITQTLKVKTSATTTSLLKLRRYLSIETLFLCPMIPSLRVYQIPGQNFSTYSCPVSSLLSLASNYRILIHSAIKITYICLESKRLWLLSLHWNKLKVKVLVAQLCPTLRSCGLQPTTLLCPWDSPGKNPGVGSHSLLQGIFPTQGSNPGLLYRRQTLYHLSHQGSSLEQRHLQNVIFDNILFCKNPTIKFQSRNYINIVMTEKK